MYIEFTFDSTDGRELEIAGEILNGHIHFKTYQNGKKIPNGTLSTLDWKYIESFMKENCEPEISTESDLYDRQSD